MYQLAFDTPPLTEEVPDAHAIVLGATEGFTTIGNIVEANVGCERRLPQC
jgi:hypothetical protein